MSFKLNARMAARIDASLEIRQGKQQPQPVRPLFIFPT